MKVGEVYALLGMDFAQFNKDERTAKRRTETLGSSLSGVLKNAFSFTLGMGFFQAVQAGFKATVGAAIDFNSTLQQAMIGFTNMLGDANKARAFLDSLADFGAKTPFAFEDLLTASQRMMALGFESQEVIPTLTAIGDAMAAMGRRIDGIDAVILALGQMRMAGRVNAQDMLQLTNAGIDAWEILAGAIGKSVAETRKMAEAGQIEGRWAASVILEGVGKRFAGQMSQMENSWKGAWSTIRDIARMTIGAVTKDIFQGANRWLVKVKDTMSGFYEAFREGGLGYALEETFGPRTTAMVYALTGAARGLLKTFLAFKTASLIVGMAAGAVRLFTAAQLALQGSLVAGPGVLKLVSDIILYYKCLIPATVGTFGFSTALTYLKAALMAVQTALGAVIWPILIIGALLMGGTALWSKYTQAVQSAAQKAQMERMAQQQQEYADDVTEAAKGTEAQADALKEMGKAASKNLQSFDEVHTLVEDVAATTLGGAMTLDAGLATPAIPEMELPDFSFDFDAAIAGAKAEMGGFWGWLKQSAIDAFGSVKQWGIDLWAGVKDRWLDFKDWCGGFWENLKTAGGQAWNTIKTDASNLWEGAKGAWGSFKDWATGHWESIKANASQTWQDVKTGAATGWANIKTTIATKWDEIRTGASNTWANIKTSASTAWQDLKANTSTAWGNIKNTISQHWNELRAEAPQTWETIKTSIESRWEALKASAPQKWEDIKTAITTRFESAKTTVLAAAQDLYDKVPKTWDKMRAAIADLKDKVVNAITGPFEAAKQTVLGIVDAAKNWGRNLIDNIVAGIKSTASRVKDAVSGVVGTIKGWLGFGSPTDEGPGRYADQWAPNLMRMYAKGILDNISMVQSAASQVTRSLMPMTTMPAPAFAGMGAGGGTFGARSGSLADELATALRGVGGIGSNRPIEVTINIDGRRMARVLIPAIQSEQDRVEAETIIRTK